MGDRIVWEAEGEGGGLRESGNLGSLETPPRRKGSKEWQMETRWKPARLQVDSFQSASPTYFQILYIR